MTSTQNPLSRMAGGLAAATAAIVLACAVGPADQASAAGGYTSATYSGCPASAPYYKVSYTGYALCSRYP